MQYFIIEGDKRYVDGPNIINWYEKIDIRNINKDNSYKLPKRIVLKVSPNKNIIFTDIITKPFLLVSDKFKKIIQIYEPRIIYKQVALLDQENEKTELYHLPILPKVECLNVKSRFNQDRSIIKEAALDYDKIKDYSLFQISGVKSIYTVIRLDLLESILRRGGRGIAISEVELVME